MVRARFTIVAVAGWFGIVAGGGCGPTEQEKFRVLSQEINRLKVETIELEEQLAGRDARIESLTGQIRNLQTEGRLPPSPLFEIEKVVILDISDGVNLDDRPGDDGVAVYFRPVDADGDVLKVGGPITIKLLDHAEPGQTRTVGFALLTDADFIRKAWYGRFWTNHYKVEVPFTAGFEPKPGQEIDIWMEFVDLATGRPFTATKTIAVEAIRSDADGGG
ncbi:MAG: hypothetical protein HOP29_00185 [Phycisphaerales bacterium]|nr:hypothetical protein [Phycisphaerales bacterium]